MNDDMIDFNLWIDAMAPVLGLSIDEEARKGVAINLEVATRMAGILDAIKVEDHDEPLPVFRP
jgi:hypothetical protein